MARKFTIYQDGDVRVWRTSQADAGKRLLGMLLAEGVADAEGEGSEPLTVDVIGEKSEDGLGDDLLEMKISIKGKYVEYEDDED